MLSTSQTSEVISYINRCPGDRVHVTQIMKATGIGIDEIREFLLSCFGSDPPRFDDIQRNGTYNFGNGWIEFETEQIDHGRVLMYRNLGFLSILIAFVITFFIDISSHFLIIIPLLYIAAIFLFLKAIRLYSDLERHEKSIASFFILNALFL